MRQKHFESNQELIERFQDYLIECQENNKSPNIAGFARAMFCCKDTLLKYKKEGHPYFDGMKLIYTFLEDETINDGKMTDNFKKFYMINTFEDYNDTTKVLSNNINNNLNTDVSKLSPEEIEAKIAEELKNRQKAFENP